MWEFSGKPENVHIKQTETRKNISWALQNCSYNFEISTLTPLAADCYFGLRLAVQFSWPTTYSPICSAFMTGL